MSGLDAITFWGIMRCLYWLYIVAAVATAFSVVLNNRVPVKTLAWVLVILGVPYMGLFIYYFFGRDTRRRRLINKQSLTQIQRRCFPTHDKAEIAASLPKRFVSLVKFFENVADAYPVTNNSIEILSDGASFFTRLIREIYAAKEHIHVQFYIFMDDAVGHLLRDVLMDKARDGVEVRVLYDDVGCWRVDKNFFEEMRCAGMYVQPFLKERFPMLSSSLNYRNHRKVVVIDGKTAFIGGMNVADRYVTGGGRGSWRDLMLCVRGEAVYGIQVSFLVDWYFADRSLVSGLRYFPKVDVAPGPMMQVVVSNPIGRWREMLQGVGHLVSNCKGYLYIQTPYFMPSDFVLTAILNLALAGVDVRIMVPERSDSSITELASRSFLGEVMYAGVKVYLYRGGFLHSKMLVCDDTLASVGSANIDFRSFECNFEINSFVYDEGVARQLKSLFLEDTRACRLYTYKEYKERPLRQHFKESLARLFSPVL